jgi:uncharacterized damage-inducible protein DinB
MDTVTATTTIRQSFPRVTLALDYFDEVAAQIPEDLLHWRPTDPSGRFCFSLAELVMHVADARRMFGSQLSEASDGEPAWTTSMGPKDDGTWDFRAPENRQQLLASLRSARIGIETVLDQDAELLHQSTPGSRAMYQRSLDWYAERGKEVPAELLENGPGTVQRVLMSALVHEAGHRGALQTLLRLHGINVPDGE